MKTLIIYATKYGCTEKCANILAKELGNDVKLVNIKFESNVDVTDYDTVIIGGSVYIGKIQKEISEFCKNNINKLKEKNIGLFICAMQEKMIETEINQNFLPELLIKAKSIKHFGGEFLLDKMGLMDKIIVKKVAKVTTNKSNILTENIKKFAIEIAS